MPKQKQATPLALRTDTQIHAYHLFNIQLQNVN